MCIRDRDLISYLSANALIQYIANLRSRANDNISNKFIIMKIKWILFQCKNKSCHRPTKLHCFTNVLAAFFVTLPEFRGARSSGFGAEILSVLLSWNERERNAGTTLHILQRKPPLRRLDLIVYLVLMCFSRISPVFFWLKYSSRNSRILPI